MPSVGKAPVLRLGSERRGEEAEDEQGGEPVGLHASDTIALRSPASLDFHAPLRN
jgi:hypothetical protein